MNEIVKIIVDYASLVILLASIIITAINAIILYARKKQVKNVEEVKEELNDTKSGTEGTEGLLELLTKALPEAMKLAEGTGVSGVAKKLLALSQIVLECNTKGINYNENKEVIDEALENLISFSRDVNTKPKEY